MPRRCLLRPLGLTAALLLVAGPSEAGSIDEITVIKFPWEPGPGETTVEVPLPELLGQYLGGPGVKQTEWDAGVEFGRLSNVWVRVGIDDAPGGFCTTSIPAHCSGPLFRMRFEGEQRGAGFVSRGGFLVDGDLTPFEDGQGQIEFEFGFASTLGGEFQAYSQTDPGTVVELTLLLTGVILPEPAAVGMLLGGFGAVLGLRRGRASGPR